MRTTALLGREPSPWKKLLGLYAALLAHGTDMSAVAVSMMIPQISASAVSDYMWDCQVGGRVVG